MGVVFGEAGQDLFSEGFVEREVFLDDLVELGLQHLFVAVELPAALGAFMFILLNDVFGGAEGAVAMLG